MLALPGRRPVCVQGTDTGGPALNKGLDSRSQLEQGREVWKATCLSTVIPPLLEEMRTGAPDDPWWSRPELKFQQF